MEDSQNDTQAQITALTETLHKFMQDQNTRHEQLTARLDQLDRRFLEHQDDLQDRNDRRLARDDRGGRPQHVREHDARARPQRGYDQYFDLDDTHSRYREDDITRKVKIEAPSFDGRHEPQEFSDWIADMDAYFDWYDMSESRRIRFARMKLVGSAKIYWTSVERHLAKTHQDPIETWDEMKEKLKEKYLPPSYLDRLMDQLSTLRQGNLSVKEYMDKFDDLVYRCNVQEEPRFALSRFRTGLRPDIRHEMAPHLVTSVDEAYHLALEMERYLKAPTYRKFTSPVGDQPKRQFDKNVKSNNIAAQDQKGKSVTGESSKQGPKGPKCYNCQGFGHFAYQCPNRSLFIDGSYEGHENDGDNSGDTEEIYAPDSGASDAEDALADAAAHLHVVRCLLASPRDEEDWRRTNIFHTYFKHDDKFYKLMIDGGSCVNIIAKSAVERMNLKAEPHPQPYNVTWVDKTAHPVTQRCLVPIQFSSYQDRIWCDVLPMDAAHVLLGRPWLYDLDVTSFGRSNTYTFKFNGKKIVLTPSRPKAPSDHKNGSVTTKAGTKPVHLLGKSNFKVLTCGQRKGGPKSQNEPYPHQR